MLPLLPVVGGIVVGALGGVVGGVFGWLGYQESRKSNTIAIWSTIISTIIGIAMFYIFYLQIPEENKKSDILNYYDDGSIHYSGNGSFEEREDVWKWYTTDGILIKLETYDNNKLDGKYKEFYTNGNLKVDGRYDNGVKDLTKWKCYNNNGSIKQCSIKYSPKVKEEKNFFESSYSTILDFAYEVNNLFTKTIEFFKSLYASILDFAYIVNNFFSK
jgi:hypothetical protein